jgi:succinyl-diaminopimelate desuccinylase
VGGYPEVLGDCCLNGEPTGPLCCRFGEKGLLWLSFKVVTAGAHGAHVQRSKSSITIAAAVIGELQALGTLGTPSGDPVVQVLREHANTIDQSYGVGAAKIVDKVTVNPGVIKGGLKINMIAANCEFEVDIRLPPGITKEAVLPKVDQIVGRFPEVTYEIVNYDPPSATPPHMEMVKYIQQNAELVSGITPAPVIGLGGTDARLWRQKGVPAVVYGPSPTGMGAVNERVTVEEFMHTVQTHVLSAYDFLSRE